MINIFTQDAFQCSAQEGGFIKASWDGFGGEEFFDIYKLNH